MALQRTFQTTLTALSGADDIRMTFYKSDAAATPPNMVRVSTSVVHTDGSSATYDVDLASSGLTPGERSTLRTLLTKIRDNATTQLGYVNV